MSEVENVEVNTNAWHSDSHIVLAISTGVDSMVLLHQLLTNYRQTYRQITCLHVNHGIRTAAKTEQSFMQRYCKQHGVDLFVHELDLSHVIAAGNSIENEARTLRYAWFDQMMEELEADVLLTAHHLDDQIETIFYRIMTGRSTRSKLGMDECILRKNYVLAKPLLAVSKSEIRTYQHEQHVPFFEDETNQDNQYVRNDIRNRLLPAIDENRQLSTQQLLKIKAWHDEQLNVIHQEADHFILNKVKAETNNHEIHFSRSEFLKLRHTVKIVVLDKLIDKLALEQPISEKMYESWLTQIASNHAQCTLYTTDKWIIHIAYDKFILMANYEQALSQIKVNQPGTYTFSRYNIEIQADLPQDEFPLTIRTRQVGDKYELNGSTGHKKVSRLFIDEKIIQRQREEMPVIVTADEEIIAVGTLFLKQKYNELISISNMGEE